MGAAGELGFVFEVTARCNLNCTFCYNVWKEPAASVPADLPLPDIEMFLTRLLRQARPRWIALSGGECLLRNDLEDIVRLVVDNCAAAIGVCTNGILLSAQRCLDLVEAGVKYFEVSLFTSSETGFAGLAGSPLYAPTRQALLHVREAGSILTVSSVLTRPNIAQLSDIIDVAFALGADRMALLRFASSGRGSSQAQELSPSIHELEDALSLADRKAAELGFPITVAIPIPACLLRRKYQALSFGACQCGVNKWAIDPAGNLRVCEQSNVIIGSLLHSEFDLLRRSPAVSAFRGLMHNAACAHCKTFRNCQGGCRFAQAAADN